MNGREHVNKYCESDGFHDERGRVGLLRISRKYRAM